MESYLVQLGFSTAFERVSHSGLLFKFKSIGVGGCVLSICREFLSTHRQRVVGDAAASEWIPIVSGMPLGSVLGPLPFIKYPSKMFELVVIRKPADRPAGAASLKRYLARIQEWCNHWCMVLNPKKTLGL